jgi:uncharacterized damage-inducible protein DinB
MVNEPRLYWAVSQLARVMVGLSDETLGQEWKWRDHGEGLRMALLGTHHELRDLAVTLASGRLAEGIPVTAAQHILGQYHAAFRDLEAVLLGAEDDDLDRPPAEDEWPLRQVLAHMIRADRGFFGLVYFAVEQQRTGQQPSRPTTEDFKSLYGTDDDSDQVIDGGGLLDILDYHQALHERILHELAGLSQQDLSALSPFWEPEPLPVRYRLHRFDAHLRQHTVQAEKTLAAIGHTPNEAWRLLRLVYNVLAEIEGSLIGAWDYGIDRRQEVAKMISNRADEIAAIVVKL